MNIPVSGLILIPLTIGIFCFSSYLAEWAILTAVLQGAALLNVSGGFAVGLSPYYLVAALMATVVVPQWATGRLRFAPEEPTRQNIRVLAIFVLFCVLSAFVLPVLFRGVPVDAARAGVDLSYFEQSPLHWSFSNAGQAGYIVLDFLMLLRLVQVSIMPGRMDRLVNAFSWSGMFVVAVGSYQMLCHWSGLPFPAWLFNSNKAWSELPNQLIGSGFSRVTATFVEPSQAASFLAAWAVFEVSLAVGGARHDGRHWLFAAVGCVALVATTSTTGYVTAAVMWIVMMWDCIRTALRHGIIKIKPTLAAIALGGIASFALLISQSANQLLNAVILNKGESASALHRTATFSRAIQVCMDSWGLGVGLGSNRAMSSFFYVLSNLGIPGIILVGWLLLQTSAQIRRQLWSTCYNREGQLVVRALAAGFVATLLAMVVSGAEITQPGLWVLWGLLLGSARQNWLQRRQVSPNYAPEILSEPIGRAGDYRAARVSRASVSNTALRWPDVV